MFSAGIPERAEICPGYEGMNISISAKVQPVQRCGENAKKSLYSARRRGVLYKARKKGYCIVLVERGYCIVLVERGIV